MYVWRCRAESRKASEVSLVEQGVEVLDAADQFEPELWPKEHLIEKLE
jgi:hypothetical protein